MTHETLMPFSIIFIVILGLFIRSFIKGTFWSSSLISGLGGAFFGVVLTGLLLWLAFEQIGWEAGAGFFFLIVYVAYFAIPIAAIVGAILFIGIGALIRKKSRAITTTSEDSSPQSIASPSLLVTGQPADSTSQFTIMKRPLIVWGVTIFIALGILGQIASLFSVGFLPYYSGMNLLFSVNYMSIGLVLPQIIFIRLFFNLRKSSLKWLYISFGLTIVINIVFMLLIQAAVMAVLGWIVWYYISHKKVNSQPVFS